MVEAVTVREDRIRPILGICPQEPAAKFFDIKILPVSYCAPRINSHFPANVKILMIEG